MVRGAGTGGGGDLGEPSSPLDTGCSAAVGLTVVGGELVDVFVVVGVVVEVGA